MQQLLIVLSIVLGVGLAPTPVNAPVGISPAIKQEVQQEVQKPVEPAWIKGEATAYYNGKDKMNGELGITASGYDLDNGIRFKGYRILASDDSIPFGTIVELSLEDGSIITGVVLDRGGMITENKFDVVFSTKAECFEFGRKPIKYRIVGKVEL